MSELSLRHEDLPGGVRWIEAAGVLDAATADRLDQLITAGLTAGRPRVAVDLEGVTYIASAGVGVFVGNLEPCRRAGGALVLVHPQGSRTHATDATPMTGMTERFNVLEVFNLLGLTDQLTVVGSRDAALRALGGAA